jgi:hypothetical protein
MLTLELIRNIRAFITRATLKGEEVPAFNEAMAALADEETRLCTPPPLPPPE